ncbi:MAG: tripartite tricarboxylate transporter permease [Nanoarchaeota archaeon]|nr:tripartite tricarboxylate transporter permease [Nanoarchaeota archaeon]MBU1269438.1 tripartite tricarboxylate transporter permease [Nanoarchaeota archaeon]MBU1604225.1 tripartite tricarboxylate transporter permease [Nanoarchaeota archaeon]MBU2443862.1 tripartite tricarboxylate transporter permease [Nanoarchaeota archaeon]
MLLELIIAIVLGIAAGIITGLTPGIHINLVSLLVLSAAPFLSAYFSLIALACFIISMSVTHSFLDPIPSIYLGAPDSDQALGVLPGHRYLLAGHGYTALKLTVIGSFGALILSVLLFPLFIQVVKYGYELISAYIGYILLAVVVFMILRDNKKLWALLVFAMSGVLGLIVLNIPGFNDPLFPMLSGLFGLSTLLISINGNESMPIQKVEEELKLSKKLTIKALLSGQLSGFLTAVLPGVGAATAAVLSLQITRNLGDKGFMILTGSINTVNFILSMTALYVLDKARNGAIIVVQKLVEDIILAHIMIFLCVTMIAGGVAVFLALKIGKVFSNLITRVNYRKLVISIILLIIFLVFLLTSWLGLLVLIVSTAIGLIPAIVKTTRTQSMGCIMLPVMLYFLL